MRQGTMLNRVITYVLLMLGGTLFPEQSTNTLAQELLYARRAGGTVLDAGFGVAADASGNSLVTGYFWGTATFGAGEPNETSLSAVGIDVFIAKYSPDGMLRWVTQAGGTDYAAGMAIAVDSEDNNLVTGRFSDTAKFGASEPNETVLSSVGEQDDMFVAKYAQDGALIWAKQAGGGKLVEGLGIATDAAGNGLVTGDYEDIVRFGAGEAQETTLVSTGASDVFVAKYAPDGTLLWAKRAGGTSYERGLSIAADADGNSLVTGTFQGTATFGPGETSETTLSATGQHDVFVAKYALDGNLLWAVQAGGSEYTNGHGIAVDSAGNGVVTGVFTGTATFDAGGPHETVLVSLGHGDIYLAKYSPDGTLLWVTQAGGTEYDSGHSIAIDRSGNSLATGFYTDKATFGATESNETSLQSVDGEDIFVAKYAPDGTLLWVTQAGGDAFEMGWAIAADPGGNALVTGYFEGTTTFGTGEPNETTLESAGYGDIFLLALDGGAPAVEIGSEFTRAFSGTGIQRIQLIFEVSGVDRTEFAVFAQGPSLTDEGVAGALPDPQINLLQEGILIASNNDWQTDASASQAQSVAKDLGITLADEDAAMVRYLGAGLYTVVVTDVTGVTGITRVGALNVAALSGGTTTADVTAEFTRAFSGIGMERIQLVFDVVGSDTARFGVFAQGPSLTNEGVEGALPNPQISLLKDGVLIATNDDWQTDPTAPDVQAVAAALGVNLAEQDSAMIRSLGAGLYTVVVTDVDGAVGISRVGALNVEGLTGEGEGDISAGVWRGSDP